MPRKKEESVPNSKITDYFETTASVEGRPKRSNDNCHQVAPTTSSSTVLKSKRPRKRARSTSKSKTNKKDPLKAATMEESQLDVKFEDLFHNSKVQQTAFELFNVQLDNKRLTKLASTPSTGHRSTRSCSKKYDAVANLELQTEPVRTNNDSPPEPDPTAAAMVQSLLRRYERGRKSKKKLPSKDKLPQFDSSDEEFFLLEEDKVGADGDDFVDCCVQDYDLKKKLCEAHYSVIQKMSAKEVRRLGKDILPELEEIKNGTLKSERHEVFKTCGLSKSKLREMTVADPFDANQEHKVMKLIERKLFACTDLTENNGEVLHYIGNVLVPEALIRIFAKANHIDIELAEKELRFKGKYDGEVSRDLLIAINQG